MNFSCKIEINMEQKQQRESTALCFEKKQVSLNLELSEAVVQKCS